MIVLQFSLNFSYLLFPDILVHETRINAADLPITLPIERITADNMPENAEGIIIFMIVWVLFAPRAKDASRKL